MGRSVLDEEILIGTAPESPKRRPPVSVSSLEEEGDKENHASSTSTSFTFTVRNSPTRTLLPKNASLDNNEEAANNERNEQICSNNNDGEEHKSSAAIMKEECDEMLDNLDLLKTIGKKINLIFHSILNLEKNISISLLVVMDIFIQVHY